MNTKRLAPIISYSRRGSDSTAYDSSSSAGETVPSLDHRSDSIDSQFEPTPEGSGIFSTRPRDSTDTYCTTVAPLDEEEEDDDCLDEDDELYFDYSKLPYHQRAVPATPAQFAELFPSTRRLLIKHDDSTFDGNMNVRVDALVHSRSARYEQRITLFHARIYDLQDREYSIRRYGRDCGREVANVKRKVVRVPQRPGLQRTVSKAFNSFRGKDEADREFGRVQRQDSGYSSSGCDDTADESDREPEPEPSSKSCTLEFSNYAHVDLTRRAKKYDFEYWGNTYSWKRNLRHEGTTFEEASYALVNNTTRNVVAEIRPDPITPAIAAEEEAKGGFVPPCSMYLKSSHQDPVCADRADVADVIVSTGLITLIDDNFKRKFHQKRSVQISLPGGKSPFKMEYVGPRRFLEEMLGGNARRPAASRAHSLQWSNSRPATPTRAQTTPVRRPTA